MNQSRRRSLPHYLALGRLSTSPQGVTITPVAGPGPGAAASEAASGWVLSTAGGTGPPGSATWGCRGRSRPQNRRVRTISESSAAVSTEIQVMVRAMRTAGPAAAEPRPESHQSRAAAAANVHGVASARW